MAYKVYAGTMQPALNVNEPISANISDPLTGDYPYVRMEWLTKELIYGPDTQCITDVKLEEAQNDIGTFEFTMPKVLLDPSTSSGQRSNPIYDSLDIAVTKIMIEEDDAIIWMGTVTSVTLAFDLSKKVLCKDPLYRSKYGKGLYRPQKLTVPDIISGLCPGTWSLKSEISKGCKIVATRGICDDLNGKSFDTTKDGTQQLTSWEAFDKYVLSEYGGYLRLRYIADSSHTKIAVVLDYLTEIKDQTNQAVQYGQNLIDIEITREITSDIRNAMIAYGYTTTTSGWWIWETSSTSFISGNVQKDNSSINKYDSIGETIFKDGNTTKDELSKLAQEELAKYDHDITPEVTVKAFDLCDAGVDTDHLGFLKKTRIVSAPHGIDEWMVCTKAVIPLDKPDQKEFTFGRPPEKLTAQKNILEAVAEQIGLSVRGLVSYAQGKG